MNDHKQVKWHLWIFGSVFLYTLLSGLFIQLVFLPHIAPSMHMADGVLSSNYDVYTFHFYAKKLAGLIIEDGWSHWEWRAGSSGISSLTAIFYVFFGPHLWIMMPYNALVHALAAVMLFDLFRRILPSFPPQLLIFGIIPFVAFPSTLLWTAQLHKDGLFLLAVFMMMWVIIRLLQFDARPRNWLYTLCLLFVCLLGQFFLWWFKRDRIILFELFLMICPFLVLIENWVKHRRLIGWNVFVKISLVCATLITGNLFIHWNIRPTIRVKAPTETPETIDLNVSEWSSEKWKSTNWIPSAMDERLALLTEVRNNYFVRHTESNTPIDSEVHFNSVNDMFSYIPRLLQISYFAPFPINWLDESSNKSLTLLRRIVSLETAVVYLSYFGLLFLIHGNWRNQYFWYLMGMITAFMLIYAYVFPNMGTLYRQRFGFLAIVTGFGFIGLAKMFFERQKCLIALRVSKEDQL